RGHVARDAASLDLWVGSVLSDLLAEPGVLEGLRETGPGTAAAELELAGGREQLDELAAQAGDGQITARQMAIASRGLIARAAQLEEALAAAARSSVLAALTAGSGPVVWDELTLDGRRALIKALVTVTILPAPKGRPPGWKPGEPYLN